MISTGSANGSGPGKLLFSSNSAFGTTTANIMAFDHATANVGIGTNNPAARLDVSSGGGSTAPQARIFQSNGADFGRLRFASAASGTSHWDIGALTTGTAGTELFTFWNQAAGINVMSLRGTGQVTLANTDWDVNGLLLQSTSTSAGSSIRFTNPAVGNRTYDIIGSTGSGAATGVGAFGIWDDTGGAYRFVIDATGQIGIGTNIPDHKLHIVDTQAGNQIAKIENLSTSTTSDGLGILLNNTTASNDYIFFERTGELVQGRIAANGSGAVQYLTASDLRLKKNISDYSGGLDAVMRMRPRNYVFKSSPEIPRVGFIAQELKSIFPEAVNGSEDSDPETEPMMVDYSKLTPVLVKAIQEQQQLINELKSKNAELERQLTESKKVEGQVTNLRAELDEIKKVLGLEAKKK